MAYSYVFFFRCTYDSFVVQKQRKEEMLGETKWVISGWFQLKCCELWQTGIEWRTDERLNDVHVNLLFSSSLNILAKITSIV